MVVFSKALSILVNLALIVNWSGIVESAAGGKCTKNADCGPSGACKGGNCIRGRSILPSIGPCKKAGEYCAQLIVGTCCEPLKCGLLSFKCEAAAHNKKGKTDRKGTKNMAGYYYDDYDDYDCRTPREQCNQDRDCCSGYCRGYGYYGYCA